MYRQGDLLFVPESESAVPLNIPALYDYAAGPSREYVVHHGNATGHKHVIPARSPVQVFPSRNAGLWIVMNTSHATQIEVSHPEHAPLPLTHGVYRMTVQRRYLPGRDWASIRGDMEHAED